MVILLWRKISNLIIIGAANSDSLRYDSEEEKKIDSEIKSFAFSSDSCNEFGDESRFQMVSLPLLNNKDIEYLSQSMLKEVLRIDSKISRNTSKHVSKISGNNPFFASEFCKVIVCAIVRLDEEIESNQRVLTTQERDKEIESLVQSIKSDQMSGIMSLKLDSVSSECQLILKAAAVASFEGYPFSVSLISFLLPDLLVSRRGGLVKSDIRLSLSINIQSFIRELCLLDFFFPVPVNVISNSSLLKSDSFNESIVNQRDFEVGFGFTSVEFRNYIYDLMVEDQRKYFHEKTANFLDDLYISDFLSSPNHLKQIGMHWERADEWTKAMNGFYEAGVLFDKVGAIVDSYNCLALSYTMLSKMKKGHYYFSNLKFTLLDAMKQYEAASKEYVDESISEKVDALFNLFSNNSDNLETAIKMLTKYGQAVQSLAYRSEKAPEIFIEALCYITLIKYNYESNIRNGSSMFMIKDKTIVFPVFSGIALMFRFQRIPDDAENSHELQICQLFLSMAEFLKEEVHLIQANANLVLFFLKKNKLDKFEVHLEAIKNIYDVDRHSQKLVDSYGSDWAIHRFSIGCFQLTFFGKFRKSKSFAMFLENYLSKVSHTKTIIDTTLALISFNIFLGQYNIANSYMDKLSTMMNSFSIMMPSLPYLFTLLKILSNSPQSESDFEKANTVTDIDLLSILDSQSYNESSRATYYFVVEKALSRSIESLQAELCLLKLTNLSSSDDSSKYFDFLDCGLKYIERYLNLSYSNNFEYIIPHSYCLLLKAQLIMMDSRISQSERLSTSRSILMQLIKRSDESKVVFIRLLAGYQLIKSDIDKVEGKSAIERFFISNKSEDIDMIREIEEVDLFKRISDSYYSSK